MKNVTRATDTHYGYVTRVTDTHYDKCVNNNKHINIGNIFTRLLAKLQIKNCFKLNFHLICNYSVYTTGATAKRRLSLLGPVSSTVHPDILSCSIAVHHRALRATRHTAAHTISECNITVPFLHWHLSGVSIPVPLGEFSAPTNPQTNWIATEWRGNKERT